MLFQREKIFSRFYSKRPKNEAFGKASYFLRLGIDNSEIQKIGLNNNINVVNRPLKISGDSATTESAIQHIIEQSNQEIFQDAIFF